MDLTKVVLEDCISRIRSLEQRDQKFQEQFSDMCKVCIEMDKVDYANS